MNRLRCAADGRSLTPALPEPDPGAGFGGKFVVHFLFIWGLVKGVDARAAWKWELRNSGIVEQRLGHSELI